MNKPLVSVIVPVYNVEKYIKRCIDSILDQAYPNLEVILVNDGSTDNSLQIIEGYSDKCVIINKKNGGQSSARNMGVNIASGKYLLFVDADDYLLHGAINLLVNKMEESHSDICCYRMATHDMNGNIYLIGNDFTISSYNSNDEIIKDALIGRNIKTSVCCKMYLVSFIKENKISFHEGVINEDYIYTDIIALKATTATFINIPLYVIEQREGSTSRAYRDINITVYFKNVEIVKEAYRQCGLLEPYEQLLESQMIVGILYTLVGIAYSSRGYKNFLHYVRLLNGSQFYSRFYVDSIRKRGLKLYSIYLLVNIPVAFFSLVKLFKIMGTKRYN